MRGKKYFWLKLKKDFFKRHDIQIIESMPNGKDYILFYLKMLLESVDHNGNLRFSDVIPYNESMLSTITNTNVDTVKSAMTVFTELKMIEILDDQTIFMAEVEKMLGTETYWAEQKRKQRIGNCPTNVLTLSNVSNQEIDIEIDKELDIEKDNNQSSPSAYKFYEVERFGILTPYVADKIGNWIDDTSEEVVIKALKIAVENDKRNWKYTEAILQSWYSKGLKTIADIEVEEKEYERQKQNKQSYKPKGRQEIIPEWMQPGYASKETEKSDEELAKFEAELERLMSGGKDKAAAKKDVIEQLLRGEK